MRSSRLPRWKTRARNTRSVDAYKRDHPYCEVCGARTWDVHHKHPRQHRAWYPGDVNEERNLVAVCRNCHSKWGWARYVGDSPNPRGNVDAYARGYLRLCADQPGKKWHKMAPAWLLEYCKDSGEMLTEEGFNEGNG
jgi:hypothetical protein